MTTYQTLQQKAQGLAFILGPLLITLGAAVYLLGIERSPDGTSSWVEGIFLAYGFLIMVPIFFELARVLGARSPKLGITCAVTGLGIGFGVTPGTDRIMQVELVNAGFNESIWNLSTHPGWIPIVIWLFLGMFTSILLGAGFLWRGGIPRWAGVLLILAPILFVIGQGAGEGIAWWRVSIFYPLACLTWLVALAPIGLRYLAGDSQAYELEVATAG